MRYGKKIYAQKIRSFFGSKLYLIKLIVGLMIIATVPMCITVAIIYNRYSFRMVEEISNANIKLLGQINIHVDSIINEMTGITLNNSLDKDITYFSQTHFYDDVVRFYKLVENFQSIRVSNKNVDSIFVYYDDFEYVVGNPIGHSMGLYYLKDIRDKSWYDLYREGKTNQIIMRNIYENNECLTLMKPVRDSSFKVKGVIVINVSSNNIYSMIEGLQDHSLGNVFIQDSKNSIALIKGDHSSKTELDYINHLKYGYENFFVDKFDDTKNIIAYTTSSKNGWRYISITPMEKILEKIGLFKNLTILITIMIITAYIVLSVIYGRYLYKPIARIVKNIIGSSYPEKGQGDELQTISKAFSYVVEIKNNMECLINENKSIMKNKLVNNILLGYEYQDEEINDKLKYYNIEMPCSQFCVLLTRPDNSNLYSKNYRTERDVSWKICILTLAEQLMKEKLINGAVAETASENIAIIVNFAQIDAAGLHKKIRSFCDELRETLAVSLPFTISIGAGNTVERISNIYESYHQAVKALEYRVILGRNKTIFSEDIKIIDQVPLQSEIFEKKIHQYIINNRLEDLYDLVDEMIREVSIKKQNTLENTMDFFIQVLSCSMKILEKECIKAYKKVTMTPVYTDFLKNETLEDIGQWLKSFYKNVNDNMDSIQHTTISNRKIERAEKFILENYNRELTLQMVAEEVGLNPSYLSNIFKEETGKNFIDYLNMIRVEKSKDFMIDERTPIYEIAKKVGFSNDRGYMRFFKKYMGCTPGRYRETLLRRESKTAL